MKVAIVHDHLTQYGGAEKVLQVLQEIWPEAPTFTLFYDQEKFGTTFERQQIKTSFLQKIPGAVKHYQWFLPLMPTATESYDLSEYDVVVSSSSAMAKGIITQASTVHICYCHTPTRYLWSDTHRYVDELRYPGFVKKLIPFSLKKLRVWDQAAAQRPDVFVANSKTVHTRIQKYYKRDSQVLHPPVNTEQFKISNTVGPYFLTGGRLVAYKRFDITVQAFNRLGIPLKIFGTGPELVKLKAMAKSNIEFLEFVSDSELQKLYAEAKAFINPQVEDFGITIVESMASGRPVIAYAAGGACETVVDGKTGVLFDEQTWEALADAVVRFKPENFDSVKIHTYAQQFGVARFKKALKELVDSKYYELKNSNIRCGF